MSLPEKQPPGGGPAWFTPGRLLALFCVMCLFVYLDRGMIASNGVNGSPTTDTAVGTGIQGDFGLTLFQDGLLPAAFMVGLLVSSPLFAEASKRHNALRLIGMGLAVWTVATAGCGMAPGFPFLILCRMAVGVGEASFVALASPFIDDNAPPGRKALWLGMFYGCIPTGYALGYIYGGLVGSALGWRAAFLLECAAMVPFMLFCLWAPPIDIRGTHDVPAVDHRRSQEDEQSEGRELLAHGHAGGGGGAAGGLRGWATGVGQDLKVLARHPVYVLTVAAMTFYTAVLGTFAFYGPKAGRDVFGIEPATADLTFGAITIVTGIVGTMAGGALLDRMGSSLRNALLLCTGGLVAGAGLVIVAFAAAGSFPVFSTLLAAGELAMFITQAPSNAVCMWAVPPGLRPFAMSMSVVAMHVLGDVPAPPLLGALQGRLDDWRLSMSLLSLLLLAGAGASAWGYAAAATARDYRDLSLSPMDGSSAALDGSSSGEGGSLEEGGRSSGASGERLSASGRLSPEQQLLRRQPDSVADD